MNHKINRIGLYAGLAMAILMAAMSITGNFEIGPVKYIKYIVLMGFLIKAGILIKQNAPAKKFFQRAMLGGLRIVVLAGLIVAFTSLMLYVVQPEFAPMKFNLLPTNGLQAFTISVMLLIETVALGFILNFAVIQALKPGAENIQP